MSIFPQRLSSRKCSPWDNLEPILEELFSVERIEEHARSLAVAQRVTPKPAKGRPLVGPPRRERRDPAGRLQKPFAGRPRWSNGLIVDELFCPAMQQADMRVDAAHDFSVEFEHQPQDAVRGRMLRPKIQREIARLRR